MQFIINLFVGFFTSKIMIFNIILSWILLEYGFYRINPLRQTKPDHIERDKIYLPFKRNDLHKHHRLVLYILLPLMIPRIILSMLGLAITNLICYCVRL
jgi:hypothetical protein